MAGWIFRIPCRWRYSRPARYRSYCYNSKSYPGPKSRLEITGKFSSRTANDFQFQDGESRLNKPGNL